jgi:hypothetical protein
MPLCDVISYREFITRFRVIEDYWRTESPTNRGKENYTTCALLSLQIFCLKIVKIIYIPSCLIETSLGYSIFAVYAIKHREQLWYKTGRRLIKYVRTEVVWFNFRIAHYWYGEQAKIIQRAHMVRTLITIQTESNWNMESKSAKTASELLFFSWNLKAVYTQRRTLSQDKIIRKIFS